MRGGAHRILTSRSGPAARIFLSDHGRRAFRCQLRGASLRRLGAGAPIMVGGETIGAVGVSGRPVEEEIALTGAGAHLITG
ncbi:MAG TPA: heme-binding protein [Acidimicrobiia bacterium]|nr:heme-binding protein [Acidimicrobiia bacterium]